jgi:hypothetical protein
MTGSTSAAASSSTDDEDWKDYLKGLSEVRSMIFGHSFASCPEDRPGAHYLFQQVQAVAFNRVMAPQTDYPRFYTHGQLEPMTYSLGGGCADIQYRQAFVDGAKRYRIWGRLGSAHLSLIQVMDGYWGENDGSIPTRVFRLDSFPAQADGTFEVMVCAEEQKGNWLRTDPAVRKCCIFVREIFADWERETPSEIHIAPLVPALDAPVHPSEADMVGRMQSAIRFMKEFIGRYSQSMIQDVIDKVGYNVVVADDSNWPGANAASGYSFLSHKISEGEALVITLDWGAAPFWGAQVTDVWHQTCEPIYHQSSLNKVQAEEDEDGKYRIVLCLSDPGVQNWLDPVGHHRGFVELRVIPAQAVPPPQVQKVLLKDLRLRLPSARILTPQERAIRLQRRRDAALRRWMY